MEKFASSAGIDNPLPTDDSLFKTLYMIIMDATEKVTMPIQNWGMILNQLRVYFDDRVDGYL